MPRTLQCAAELNPFGLNYGSDNTLPHPSGSTTYSDFDHIGFSELIDEVRFFRHVKASRKNAEA
jgi:hypothetical protein